MLLVCGIPVVKHAGATCGTHGPMCKFLGLSFTSRVQIVLDISADLHDQASARVLRAGGSRFLVKISSQGHLPSLSSDSALT
jgi:hypothetical protein